MNEEDSWFNPGARDVDVRPVPPDRVDRRRTLFSEARGLHVARLTGLLLAAGPLFYVAAVLAAPEPIAIAKAFELFAPRQANTLKRKL